MSMEMPYSYLQNSKKLLIILHYEIPAFNAPKYQHTFNNSGSASKLFNLNRNILLPLKAGHRDKNAFHWKA